MTVRLPDNGKRFVEVWSIFCVRTEINRHAQGVLAASFALSSL